MCNNLGKGHLIPKKIHYCWLSGEKMPEAAIKCIASWKEIMPEYELVLWDKNKFDVNSTPFTQEACSVKQWAGAADYIRLYAIYTEGGIYMDTDVYVKKSFDEFLHDGFFTGHLLNNLKVPGLEVREVFHRTGADVSRASNRQQIPEVYNKFFGTAYLGTLPAASVPEQPVTPPKPAPVSTNTNRVNDNTQTGLSGYWWWSKFESGACRKYYGAYLLCNGFHN